MVLCWNEQKASPIHDHAGAHCIMVIYKFSYIEKKVLQGELTETQYHWPNEQQSESESDCDQNVPRLIKMKVKLETTLKRNEVTYMHDNIGLHRIANKTDKPAVSLHLYTPSYEYCKTFDEESGKQYGSGKCIFYSKRGNLLN
jgi:cysteine dioxygenase